MARASFYHDCRAVKDGKPGPLKIKYYHKGSTIMVPTGIHLMPEQWAKDVIVNHSRAKQMNSMLQLRMADVTGEILGLDVRGKLADMSPAELKKRLLVVIGREVESSKKENLFLPVFLDKVSKFTKKGTIGIWNNTLNRLEAYCLHEGIHLDKLTFEEITAEWMESFDAFLAKTAPNANARAINHRNIRAVFNHAKKCKKMVIPYPFDDFKIKHQETRHQDLSIEQTRALRECKLETHIAKVRDIFLLMIYLRGINAADLFTAKKKQVIGGRLEYYRCKTGAFTSVKIEPEAWEIIKRYQGEEFLLDIGERYKDTKNYLRKMDRYLKRIGPVTVGKKGKKEYKGMFQKIGSNGARHTWGSLIAELGYTIDTASEGLTHKFGHRVTNIYVNKKMRMAVDKANRRLIDYILGKDDNIAENYNILTENDNILSSLVN